MSPTTRAGKALLTRMTTRGTADNSPYEVAIAAVESEARQQEREALAERIEGLPGLVAAGDDGNLIYGVAVSRSAVLAILRALGEGAGEGVDRG